MKQKNLINISGMRKAACCLSLLLTGLGVQTAYAQNPFVRDIYTADPSAHVWEDGRLYVYPSHDINPPRGCDLMDKYHVYSTDDMVNWTDHGQILEASEVPWGSPLENGGKFMWAPDCAYRNGKYYFYFPHPDKDPWNSNWKIGIAVSDQPASGFQVLDHTLIGLPENGEIDPCVFIDDDGQAYFYYGGGNHCYGARLKDNMIELDGQLQSMTGLSDFHEGTWVFKRNDVYYLTYADNNGGANQLRYAISDNPLGPWTYKGVYLKPTTSDTSHGSVVEYKGQWWAFYHTADLSGTGLLRCICVDSLFFNANGTIQTVIQTKDPGQPYESVWRTAQGTIEAEDFNDGGQGIAYWDNTPGNRLFDYRNEGVDIGWNNRRKISYVTDTEQKEYINYSFEVLDAGIYELDFTIGTVSKATNERFYLEFDRKKATNPIRYEVPYAAVSELIIVTVSGINLTKGKHVMTFYPLGNMYFDKFTFRNTTPSGISLLNPGNEISVYPNPSGGLFHIEGIDAAFVTVSDVSGKTLLKEKPDPLHPNIDISGQAPGIYILSLQTKDRVYQSKLVKF
jgi:hypothetical protein